MVPNGLQCTENSLSYDTLSLTKSHPDSDIENGFSSA
jgi:hypothetical protein